MVLPSATEDVPVSRADDNDAPPANASEGYESTMPDGEGLNPDIASGGVYISVGNAVVADATAQF